MSIVQATGVVVSKTGITLYLADGESRVLDAQSWRTQNILDKLLGPMSRNETPVEIDLAEFSLAAALQAATGGAVQIDEKADGTVSVQVGDTVVENAETLTRHIEQALYGSNASGFQKFMESFAEIPHKHSAEELLKFMGRADLPIADDGSFLVYKFLDAKSDGVFVDHHTRNVRQRLGSLVMMPIEQVDDSRRTQCSTGLHVCSNKYGSYGDTVFIAKVWPRDVIAVPDNENGKVRVAKYHLVAQLPRGVYSKVAGRISSLTDSEGRSIVEDIIAGNHIGIIETVLIKGANGTDVEIVPVEAEKIAQPTGRKGKVLTQTEAVNVKEIRQKVKALKTAAPVAEPEKAPAKSSKSKSKATSKTAPAVLPKAPPKKAAAKTAKPAAAKVSKPVKPTPPPAPPAPTKIVKVAKLAASKPKTAAKAAPPATLTPEQKLAEAKRRYKAGQSIRQIAQDLGMCRKSLGEKLKG